MMLLIKDEAASVEIVQKYSWQSIYRIEGIDKCISL